MVVSTVPAVTIAPIARDVSGKVRQGYFPYYARPWIDDNHESFDFIVIDFPDPTN